MSTEPIDPADTRMEIEGEEGVQKVDGRTREGRAKAAGRTTGTRQATRELPRGQYVGRNGEILTRSAQAAAGDQFHVPPELKEPGWDYQWLTEHLLNNPDIVRRHNHQMYQSGWRPVLATGKWNGIFGPREDTGHVRVGDCGLYERPLQMSEDAREEEYSKAHQQMRDRDEALMGHKANARSAISDLRPNTAYKGRKTQLSIDQGYDIPKPKHELTDPGE